MKLVGGPQTLECLPPYLTEADWSTLERCTVHRDATLLVATRLKRMGMVNFKEGTQKQVMALLVWWMKDNVPAPWPLYYMSQDFCQVFQAVTVNVIAPSLLSYPANPLQLPQDWLVKAYGAEEKPALRDLSYCLLFEDLFSRAGRDEQSFATFSKHSQCCKCQGMSVVTPAWVRANVTDVRM